MKRIGIIFAVMALAAFGFLKIPCALAENVPLKVKGLYIGMDIGEVCSVMQPYLKDCSVESRKDSFVLFPVDDDGFFIMAGEETFCLAADRDKKVTYIKIDKPLVELMFHTQGIGAEMFGQKFTGAYNIGEMGSFSRNDKSGSPIAGWECTRPEGVHIMIIAQKFNLLEGGVVADCSLVMEKVAAQTDMQFD